MQLDPWVAFKAFFNPLFVKSFLALVVFAVAMRILKREVRQWKNHKSGQRIKMASMFSKNSESAMDVCPLCGGSLSSKGGKFGKFLGCANYPACKYTKSLR